MAFFHPHQELPAIEYTKIIYEKDGNVCTITFNDPERKNATDWPGEGGITDQFAHALHDAEYGGQAAPTFEPRAEPHEALASARVCRKGEDLRPPVPRMELFLRERPDRLLGALEAV